MFAIKGGGKTMHAQSRQSWRKRIRKVGTRAVGTVRGTVVSILGEY
jgi:hypothetical protein